MSVKDSPFYTERIEDVKHWPDVDKWAMINRHHKRLNQEWRKKCAGLFMEVTSNERD